MSCLFINQITQLLRAYFKREYLDKIKSLTTLFSVCLLKKKKKKKKIETGLISLTEYKKRSPEI